MYKINLYLEWSPESRAKIETFKFIQQPKLEKFRVFVAFWVIKKLLPKNLKRRFDSVFYSIFIIKLTHYKVADRTQDQIQDCTNVHHNHLMWRQTIGTFHLVRKFLCLHDIDIFLLNKLEIKKSLFELFYSEMPYFHMGIYTVSEN